MVVVIVVSKRPCCGLVAAALLLRGKLEPEAFATMANHPVDE